MRLEHDAFDDHKDEMEAATRIDGDNPEPLPDLQDDDGDEYLDALLAYAETRSGKPTVGLDEPEATKLGEQEQQIMDFATGYARTVRAQFGGK